MSYNFVASPAMAAPLTGLVFAAGGYDGLRLFSRDGLNWTEPQLGKDGETYGTIAFGGGRCVLGGRYGGKNIFNATSDGAAWQPSDHDAQYSKYVRSIVFHGGKFLAVIGNNAGGDTQPGVLPSTDGVKWEAFKPLGGKNLLRRFALGNGVLVGVGDYGRKSASQDGLNWEDLKSARPADTLVDVAFGNGAFVGGGMHGLRMRSTDGLTWTDRTAGEEGEHINAMIWDGKQFVGVGQGATYLSPNGVKWERVLNTNAPTLATFGAGIYVGSLWKGRLLRSTDGIAWEETLKLPQHVDALAYGELGAK